ncbi:MAG TPA: alpha/beta fold hydrolase [Stellaceae bacterium]|jgi:acetoacetyl-CoA synthetase|nr:alpha/beta fold hydrolase [Stellaceae bacterium]
MTEAEARREATARLFRSVRAGRSWLREAALSSGASASTASSLPGCILMRSGEGPPVFMIPGAPGSVLQLGPVAAALTLPMPVYAIKPRGFDEGETPFDRLEEMADYNIRIITDVKNSGPYLLVGYSAGGLIALEMARRLTMAGHAVPIVVLLDTYPSRQLWPLYCHLAILARQTIKSVWGLRRYSVARAGQYLGDRKHTLLWYLAQCGIRGITPSPLIPEGASPASRRLHQATVSAGEDYRPAPYRGRVVFLQPRENNNLKPRSPEQVWRRFLTDLEVRQIPGSHLTAVEGDAISTAAEVSRCLAPFAEAR